MRAWKRVLTVISCAVLLSTVASAYYHFVHYSGRTSPFIEIPEKFDLAALPNKTVQYFISDQAPTLAANDSFSGFVSQVRLAASVWNDIPSSDLRLAFGGVGLPQSTQTAPGIDIVFDEMPPGVLAQGGPAVRGDIQAVSPAPFVAIGRSKLILSKDFTSRPSFTEEFFATLVHEMGHTLGLQHTFTSSVMSIYRTRSISKAKPLGADDIVGLSLLYPVAGWNSKLGTISGQVNLSGSGVNLASVVAIQPNGIVVSALTAPDGTYTIEGLPQGNYYVYVHPLPPPLTATEATPGDVMPPVDSSNRPFAVNGYFDSQFYPGVRDYQQAFSIQVQPGQATSGINFNVSRRNFPALYAIETYGYVGDQVTKPPFLNVNAPRSMVATGQGLAQANGNPAAGLSVSVLGGSASLYSLRPYIGAAPYLILDFTLNAFAGAEGPRHLVFSLPNDMYVLPGGFQQVQKAPPQVRTITAAVDPVFGRALLITGSNFAADTVVLFDGLRALVRSVSSDGSQVTVIPPTATNGYRAVVSALNSDGQSSLLAQGVNPALYTYDLGDSQLLAGSSVGVTPISIPAGTEAMIELTGSTSFDPGSVIGLGSSDVSVKRLWVVAPNRILANVAVATGAPAGSFNLTLASGLQLYSAPASVLVQPTNPRSLALNSTVVNTATGLTSLYPGAPAAVTFTYSQALTPGSVQLSLNGTPVPVTGISGNQLSFVVPAGISTGAAVLRMTAGSDSALPIAIQIDPPPPMISVLFSSSGNVVDPTHPARTGDVLTMVVTNAGDQLSTITSNRVVVTVGGVDHTPTQLQAGTQAGSLFVQFVLGPITATPPVTLSVAVDGRRSAPIAFALAQ